jgi:uncharacterized membrane protein (Fun14 family)
MGLIDRFLFYTLWRVTLVTRQIICGFWILYLYLLDKSSGGIKINYYCLNLTVILHRLTSCILLPLYLLLTSLHSSGSYCTGWLLSFHCCVELVSYSWHNHHPGHAENIRLHCWHVCTEPLHNNGFYAFIVALLGRCLAMLCHPQNNITCWLVTWQITRRMLI